MMDTNLRDDLLRLSTHHDDPDVRDVCARALAVIDPETRRHADEQLELAGDVMAGHLCSLLANRVAEQRGRRPRITARWIHDMGLLMRRGPKHVDPVGPVDAEVIATLIHDVFAYLAEPSAKGFCWADQIRSPSALRDHWEQLEVALRRLPPGDPSAEDVVAAVRRLKAVGL